jgi:regulator of protease activity HflC (stomatin/prohibitin superfamily)
MIENKISEIHHIFNVIDILGEKRNEVYIEIENAVESKLAESGIEFFSLVLMDTDAGEAIESAIEREAVAKKEVETAIQAQEKARIEAETKVIEAESNARIKLIEAQAAADANLLLSKSITPEILKKMEMEARIKWGWIEVSGANVIVDTTP